jgi:hypothetical protein
VFDPFNYQFYYPNHIQIVGNYQFTNDYKKYFSKTFPTQINKQISNEKIQTTKHIKTDSINTKDSDLKTLNKNPVINVEINAKNKIDQKTEMYANLKNLIENADQVEKSKIKNKKAKSCNCSIF